MTERVVLATRGTRLALARTAEVARELAASWPGLVVDIEVLAPGGDELAEEIEPEVLVGDVRMAVLDGRADVGVHAYEDVPTSAAADLHIAAVPPRRDPRDVLVARTSRAFAYLPSGARVGTASRRRSAQVMRRRSDLVATPIHGNVTTRLRRLADGECEALVLAAVDLGWLGLLDQVTEHFDSDLMIPAPGQGAVALEVRAADIQAARWVGPLHDAATAYAVKAERSCLRQLGGDAQSPIGIHAVTDGETMAIFGIVAWADGTRAARMRWSGPCRPAEEVGSILADLLNAAGAQEILSGAYIPPTTRYATRRAELIKEWEQENPEDGG